MKISINRGVGEAAKNSKDLDSCVDEIAIIAGQKPTLNKAKKSSKNFNYLFR